MLCLACTEIFSKPRKLTYGTLYTWQQTTSSYSRALEDNCHLCHLIQEHRSYLRTSSPALTPDFPGNRNYTYCFKVLNEQWARWGNATKWLVAIETGGDDATGEDYLADVDRDPTNYGLSHLLANDTAPPRGFWLFLEIYGPVEHILLPIELFRGEHAELSAQLRLPHQDSTGSNEALGLAKDWLSDCMLKHPACRPDNRDGWMPTRLIEVGTTDQEGIRLVSGSAIEKLPFTALSHRWGTRTDFVLTSSNLGCYHSRIDVWTLTMTIQDAIRITRRLGFRYLWVDSICIIQDSVQDWEHESALMSKVYGRAALTIAAANSGASPEGGCFVTRNQYKVRPLKTSTNPFSATPVNQGGLSFLIRPQYLNEIWRREVKESLWYNRGWVFQERTLSPRLLIFGESQVLWACQKCQASESWPAGKDSEFFIDRFESFEVEKRRFNRLKQNPKDLDEAWWEFIVAYTTSKLTRPSDRLVALQGLVLEIEASTNLVYCEGFWATTWPWSLLWTTKIRTSDRSKDLRAPSWSWASLDDPVERSEVRTGLWESMVKLEIEQVLTASLERRQTVGLRSGLSALRVTCNVYPTVLFSDSFSCGLFIKSEFDLKAKMRAEAEAIEQEKAKDEASGESPAAGLRKPNASSESKGSIDKSSNAMDLQRRIHSTKRALKRYATEGVALSKNRTALIATWLTSSYFGLKSRYREAAQLIELDDEGLPQWRMIPAENEPFVDTEIKFEAVCSIDSAEVLGSSRKGLDAFCLPLVSNSEQTRGLLLSALPDRNGKHVYERIGIFKSENINFLKLTQVEQSVGRNILIV